MSELITMDREYVTRDGREVRIWCVDAKCDSTFRVRGEHLDNCGAWMPATWDAHGRWGGCNTHYYDLIPKPKRHKRTVWLNVYPDYPGNVHASRAEADRLLGAGRIACLELHLDFAEGEGLTP